MTRRRIIMMKKKRRDKGVKSWLAWLVLRRGRFIVILMEKLCIISRLRKKKKINLVSSNNRFFFPRYLL